MNTVLRRPADGFDRITGRGMDDPIPLLTERRNERNPVVVIIVDEKHTEGFVHGEGRETRGARGPERQSRERDEARRCRPAAALLELPVLRIGRVFHLEPPHPLLWNSGG
jgi:hypothetical protein